MSQFISDFSLDPATVANGISSGDLYFPDFGVDIDYVQPVEGNPATTSAIERSGSKGGGNDFLGQLFSIGGDAILSSAKSLGDGFASQLANALAGNTDAKERQTFETPNQAQSTGYSIGTKTLLIAGGVLVGFLGLVFAFTRR